MDLFGLLFASVLTIMTVFVLWVLARRVISGNRWGVFASHRSKDNRTIVPILRMLRNRSLRIWCDMSELSPRQSQEEAFRQPISVGMQKSAFAILFTSNEYCCSSLCMEEAALLLKRFAKHPQHIIEISLEENKVREILQLPESIPCINFQKFRSSPERIVDEVLSHIQRSSKEISEKILFFETPATDYQEQRKRLVDDARIWAYGEGKDYFENEIEHIAKPFKSQFENERIASVLDKIPAHSKEIGVKLLGYPPEAGAYMALYIFPWFLARNKLERAPLANLMLALESMYTINRRWADAASALLVCTLCMMDNRKIAFSTYSSMVDSRMKSSVKKKLLELNPIIWNQFLHEEAQETSARVERLIADIQDRSFVWGYRQRAVEALGTLGDPRAVEPILALIGPDCDIYETVIIKALQNLGDRRAVPALLRYLSSKKNNEQGCAAEALGELQEPSALVPLIQTLGTCKDESAMKQVIWALGNLGDKRAVRPLEEAYQVIKRDEGIYPNWKQILQTEIEEALGKINTQ